jgi:hypothetical protein
LSPFLSDFARSAARTQTAGAPVSSGNRAVNLIPSGGTDTLASPFASAPYTCTVPAPGPLWRGTVHTTRAADSTCVGTATPPNTHWAPVVNPAPVTVRDAPPPKCAEGRGSRQSARGRCAAVVVTGVLMLYEKSGAPSTYRTTCSVEVG